MVVDFFPQSAQKYRQPFRVRYGAKQRPKVSRAKRLETWKYSLWCWLLGSTLKTKAARRWFDFCGHRWTRHLPWRVVVDFFPQSAQKYRQPFRVRYGAKQLAPRVHIIKTAPKGMFLLCGPERTRTAYLVNANDALYQMSYGPFCCEVILPDFISSGNQQERSF